MLAFFVWVVVASVALARDSRASVAAATAVQHA